MSLNHFQQGNQDFCLRFLDVYVLRFKTENHWEKYWLLKIVISLNEWLLKIIYKHIFDCLFTFAAFLFIVKDFTFLVDRRAILTSELSLVYNFIGGVDNFLFNHLKIAEAIDLQRQVFFQLFYDEQVVTHSE